jgi:hypothetical protein
MAVPEIRDRGSVTASARTFSPPPLLQTTGNLQAARPPPLRRVGHVGAGLVPALLGAPTRGAPTIRRHLDCTPCLRHETKNWLRLLLAARFVDNIVDNPHAAAGLLRTRQAGRPLPRSAQPFQIAGARHRRQNRLKHGNRQAAEPDAKNPARFPVRTQFASFNFPRNLARAIRQGSTATDRSNGASAGQQLRSPYREGVSCCSTTKGLRRTSTTK